VAAEKAGQARAGAPVSLGQAQGSFTRARLLECAREVDELRDWDDHYVDLYGPTAVREIASSWYRTMFGESPEKPRHRSSS
jgi:hypothetical protein